MGTQHGIHHIKRLQFRISDGKETVLLQDEAYTLVVMGFCTLHKKEGDEKIRIDHYALIVFPITGTLFYLLPIMLCRKIYLKQPFHFPDFNFVRTENIDPDNLLDIDRLDILNRMDLKRIAAS